MAQIDLKHSTVYIKDGSTAVTAAAITGATLARNAYAGQTRIYTTMTGNVAINQTVAITGEDTTPPTHAVTGFTQSGGNTTSVNFSEPLLKDIAAGAALTIAGITGAGANILEIKIGEGNLTYTEKRNIEYRRNRGLLDTVREGDEEPVEVSFDFIWEYLASDVGEPVTIKEALTKTGAAADWESTAIDPCEPYAVDIEVRYHPSCATDKDELIVLQDFRWETLDHNLKDGAIACKGNCNVSRVISSRVAVDVLNAPMMRGVPREESASVAAVA
jgi:hypothetical protein